MNQDPNNLIHDWNKGGLVDLKGVVHIEFDDETLRDGLQSPSVTDPTIEQKIEIIHLMEDLGIQAVNIGLPGAGPRAYNDTLELAREIASCRMKIKPNCAARTVIADIDPVIDISQKTGIPIEVATFIGSSPIRQYVEGWSIDAVLDLSVKAVKHVTGHNLPAMYVTEDTTRAHPDDLEKLYTGAINAGARRVVIADTVGHATRTGALNVVRFIQDVIENTGQDVKIDWHGHNDRGFALASALSAIRAGVDRVHGCALGIGERSGNTSMDLLLVNLKLWGIIDNDLSRLNEYCRAVSEAVHAPVPFNYPVFGADAFRTATGVHAAAVIKAIQTGNEWLSDMVYSAVPASMVGRKQKIEIGPLSGESNVIFWLKQHGYEAQDGLVRHIFDYAKHSNRILTDEEIESFIETEFVKGSK
ncbi:MAG TPA: LeuA family protein [Bacteroidota bacterium]|nr:LeuA family protein [Bacteroidota bacterium]